MTVRFGRWPRHHDETEMLLPADTTGVLVGVRDFFNTNPWASAAFEKQRQAQRVQALSLAVQRDIQRQIALRQFGAGGQG